MGATALTIRAHHYQTSPAKVDGDSAGKRAALMSASDDGISMAPALAASGRLMTRLHASRRSVADYDTSYGRR